MAESDEIRENLGLIAMQREMLRELRDENERLRRKLGWLAWNVACIEDKSARRPIEAHELEDVVLNGKEVEDDFEHAFKTAQFFATQALDDELRELGEDTFRAAQAEAFKEIKRALRSALKELQERRAADRETERAP